MLTFEVVEADWANEQEAIGAIRRAVFIDEQNVPEDLEWDGCDATARHVLAWAGATPIATGRLLPSGHIGRMAVLSGFRGAGVGRGVLRALIELAHHSGLTEVFLNAQIQARGFYLNQGFTQSGEVFADAGIPHVRMWRRLDLASVGP